MEKGIFTSVQEKQLADMLDDVIKFKGLLELVDGYMAKVLITMLDDVLVDKLKAELKVKLATLVDAAIAEDIELSQTIAADILNDLIDIPGLDEESEGLIFKGIIEIVVGAILNRLSNVKGQIVTLKKSSMPPVSRSKVKGYKSDIEKDTIKNKDFREVEYTGKHIQLVLMSLNPGEDIGSESHPSDQFFRFEKGTGKCVIDGTQYNVTAGDAVLVPGGAEHNVSNTDLKVDLQFYTIYGPPAHQDGIKRSTKAKAESMPEEFDGKTTE